MMNHEDGKLKVKLSPKCNLGFFLLMYMSQIFV